MDSRYFQYYFPDAELENIIHMVHVTFEIETWVKEIWT